MSAEGSSTERHSMAGWGRIYSDFEMPRTAEEAMLTAQIMTADRLLQILTELQNIQIRLMRVESWLEASIPGYKHSPAYRANPGDNKDEPDPVPVQHLPIPLKGVRIR